MYTIAVVMAIGFPIDLPKPAVAPKEAPWLTVICSKPKVKPIEQVIAEHPVIHMPDLKTHQWPRVIGGELVPAFKPIQVNQPVQYQPYYSGYSSGYSGYIPGYSAPVCIGGNCPGSR